MKKVLALLLFVVSIGYAEDYEVRLSRPENPGDKVLVEVTATESMKMQVAVNGQVAKSDSTEIVVNLTGIATTMEVDDTKEATKTSIRITKCKKVENGSTIELLREGDVVVVFREKGKTVFQVNGHAAVEPLAKALNLVLSAHDSERPSDDAIFGTRKRVKVGNEWPMNLKLALEDFQGKEFTVSEKDMSGTARLDRIVEDQGEKCAQISARLKLSKLGLPMAGFTTEKGEVTVSFLGYFPLDLTKNRTYEETQMTMVISGSGSQTKDGQTVVTTLNMDSSQKRTAKYKKL